MRYVCVTLDYDGTLARNGSVAQSTIEALQRVRTSGRKLVLATGRELPDLLKVFAGATLFDRIVAENGALLYRPGSREEVVLGEPPSSEFVEQLRKRGVQPLSVGRSIVATWHPQETTVLEVIREMSLELQIIFNKNAVMILPSGVNKGSGVLAALKELNLSPHNVVGMGDAENDHAFLSSCECSIAVSNALPALKERADWATAHSHGTGVEELIELLLKDDLQELEPRLKRHHILLGATPSDGPWFLPSYGCRLLIAGSSGSGKSTVVSALVERLRESQHQICLFDPEGDYEGFERLLTLGGPDRIPTAAEILDALNNPKQSLVVNLLGVPLADRPSFFHGVLSRVQELRSRTGHPHWLIVDEAHHVLPKELANAENVIPKDPESLVLVTVHPDSVSPAILKSVNGIIAVGAEPQAVLDGFNKNTGGNLLWNASQLAPNQTGTLLVWKLCDGCVPQTVKLEPGKGERRRHHRKYAEGTLGEDRSFYFRGPFGRLNLRAQNMNLFAQIAEGVDEDTWQFHRVHGDYSRWLRETIKDGEFAGVVESIEKNNSLDAKESRRQIVEVVRKHYTAPA
jgi:HAD superfamily hydrolase (TIGR01484 family)